MPHHRKARYAAAVSIARARLSVPVFDEAWAAGAALSTEAAIDYALADEHAEPPAAHPLSPREQEVAELIARGLTSREIATQLVLSEKTIDTHADHIRQKLGLRTRAEIATWVTARAAHGRP